MDRECYEPGAIMLEEEGMVISGLLVGLNVIDFNLCIKEEDLDQPVSADPFSTAVAFLQGFVQVCVTKNMSKGGNFSEIN